MSSLLRLFTWIHTIQCIASHWLDLTTLPTANYGMAVGSHDISGDIYLLGGIADTDKIIKYSPDLNTFSTIGTTLPQSLNSQNQYWTQQADTLYMIRSSTIIAAFDLTGLSYSEPTTMLSEARIELSLAILNEFVDALSLEEFRRMNVCLRSANMALKCHLFTIISKRLLSLDDDDLDTLKQWIGLSSWHFV
eukprot:134830_1